MMQLLATGKPEPGLRAATLAYQFFPESPTACKCLAMAQLCTGDARQARGLLRRAVAAGDDDIAGPGVLRNHAYDLHHMGRGEAGIELLRITLEVYPGQASLYDALGDLYAWNGHKQDAIVAYGKALEIDPKLEATRQALAALQTP